MKRIQYALSLIKHKTLPKPTFLSSFIDQLNKNRKTPPMIFPRTPRKKVPERKPEKTPDDVPKTPPKSDNVELKTIIDRMKGEQKHDDSPNDNESDPEDKKTEELSAKLWTAIRVLAAVIAGTSFFFLSKDKVEPGLSYQALMQGVASR